MTSELRPAVEVWWKATDAWKEGLSPEDGTEAAAAVIEADREAVRAEQAAELAKYKALAEELARALARCGRIVERHNWRQSEKVDDVKHIVAEALRKYKEARDAS